jgi:hypothetical protein
MARLDTIRALERRGLAPELAKKTNDLHSGFVRFFRVISLVSRLKMPAGRMGQK